MATSQQAAVIFSAVVVVVLLSSLAHGRGAGAARQHYHVVQTSHLEPKSLCSGLKEVPSGATGTWVPVHRPFGPCSPSSRGPERAPPSLIEMLRWDQVRTEYVRRKATGMADDVLNPAKPRVTMAQVDYSPNAAFGIGSGYGGSAAIDADGDGDSMILSQTMSIDTTVDVPWIQCAPCPVPECYAQKNALFDPSRSSTSAAVRCGSPACRSLGSYGNGCSSNSTRNGGDCQYLIEYSDDRATAGTYMTDTLTISSSTTVMNFRFGCSHAVRGKFSDQTAGTMSLGGGAQSLLSQTARGFGNAFSYCVPAPSSSGFLSLGGPATRSTNSRSSRFATTPLVRNAVNPSLYLVRLQGIVVAGRRLRVPPAVFSPGAIMDSSAVVTQLPPTAYRALRRAFMRAMAAYPMNGKMGNLDTCYDFLGFTNVTVPAVSLVFGGGAVVVLDPPAVMLSGCLAFTPTSTDLSLGFIGNVQTQTHEVLYDVAAGTVGFRRGAC
uniref:Uncharacterized protein n=1 Tax=Avena sativa TaxID=4498 RepID=A0ACD6AD16_AVESA